MRIMLATGNPGKLREFQAAFADGQWDIVALPKGFVMPEETGTTFEENSAIKARAVAQAFACHALADDSGLSVDALDGRPGVLSARFAGEGATDSENSAKLLDSLDGISARNARFICALTLVDPAGQVLATAKGTCEGSILETPRGDGGFGYDPIFLPSGEDRTMAELSKAEKIAISHRGHAIVNLRKKMNN